MSSNAYEIRDRTRPRLGPATVTKIVVERKNIEEKIQENHFHGLQASPYSN